mgnify:CR=1 FL=1
MKKCIKCNRTYGDKIDKCKCGSTEFKKVEQTFLDECAG